MGAHVTPRGGLAPCGRSGLCAAASRAPRRRLDGAKQPGLLAGLTEALRTDFGSSRRDSSLHASTSSGGTVPEAILSIGGGQRGSQASDEFTDVMVTTEVEVEEQDSWHVALAAVDDFMVQTNGYRVVGVSTVGLVGAAVMLAAHRYNEWRNSAAAKRRNLVRRNRALVRYLNKYLPHSREELHAGAIGLLCKKLRFTPTETFRKYLWYLLRERTFDSEAIEDLVALKNAAGLNDNQVADALQARAHRCADKYGPLVPSTEGFTAAGVARKAEGAAYAQRLLHLVECGSLLAPGIAARRVDFRTAFGTSEAELEKLRVESVDEMDGRRLEVGDPAKLLEDDDP